MKKISIFSVLFILSSLWADKVVCSFIAGDSAVQTYDMTNTVKDIEGKLFLQVSKY